MKSSISQSSKKKPDAEDSPTSTDSTLSRLPSIPTHILDDFLFMQTEEFKAQQSKQQLLNAAERQKARAACLESLPIFSEITSFSKGSFGHGTPRRDPNNRSANDRESFSKMPTDIGSIPPSASIVAAIAIPNTICNEDVSRHDMIRQNSDLPRLRRDIVFEECNILKRHAVKKNASFS
ncbi:hypothetical protein HDU97_006585 [Phlyctochytrium planicorne]|nr:hypothetical protein HDU97_006585 [Phlyctochytrium planicorne]